MTGEEATAAIIALLNREKIPFMVVCSLSRNYYAFPRSTKDADIVIKCNREDLARLLAVLPREITADAQFSSEMVTGTSRTILHVEDSHFKIEMFFLSQNPHDLERFARRKAACTLGMDCYLPTPEDVIIQKLRWAIGGKRGKDYDDARDVMAVQGLALDFDYIRAWADKHGTRDLCEEIYESVKPFFNPDYAIESEKGGRAASVFRKTPPTTSVYFTRESFSE